MNKHKVFNRIEINETSNCFLTLKDHKENFLNNPTVRLLIPAKTKIGRISKSILANINSEIRSILALNQWKCTQNATDWFKRINEKHHYKFLIFGINDFYPSITEKLLSNAICFAEQHIAISNEHKIIIKHARKSLLFNNEQIWVKKKSGLFDVTTGAFHGAEVCELVGTFLLFQLSQHYNKVNFGLYRGDGLAVFKNTSGPQMEKIKKHFVQIFKDSALLLSIQCSMKIVNNLDVTFNLDGNSFQPYSKPDDVLSYVHAILKQIPHFIELRFAATLSSESIF